MVKCEICGRQSTKLYQVPFCDDVDVDEDGVQHPQYVPYNVCSACVPEEMVDVIDDGQQNLHSLLSGRWV